MGYYWIISFLFLTVCALKDGFQHRSVSSLFRLSVHRGHGNGWSNDVAKNPNQRAVLELGEALAWWSFLPLVSKAAETRNSVIQRFGYQLEIPMSLYDNCWCLNYTVDGGNFRAIVDTGSPFILVPSICSRAWGCFPPMPTITTTIESTLLSDTIETFGGQDYYTKWKEGTFEFPTIDGHRASLERLVFGMVNEDILLKPGGLFFGLIKYKNLDIRPTFLQQTRFQSFSFRPSEKKIILSLDPLIKKTATANSSIFELVDLRPYGCPVFNYAVKVKSLVINGVNLSSKFPNIFAIFDTGTSGCSLSDELSNDENTPANPVSIQVTMESVDERDKTRRKELTLTAKRSRENFFVITSTPIPWFKLPKSMKTSNPYFAQFVNQVEYSTSQFRPQIVVIGLALLKNNSLTVDIDEGRCMITPPKL